MIITRSRMEIFSKRLRGRVDSCTQTEDTNNDLWLQEMQQQASSTSQSRDTGDMEVESNESRTVVQTFKTVEGDPDPALGIPCRPALSNFFTGSLFLNDLSTVPGPPVAAQITSTGVRLLGCVPLKGSETVAPAEEMYVPGWPPVARTRKRRRNWNCVIS